MTWLSDMKALWQRFIQWERLVLLREKQWRFPIYGTTEEFEQRFNFLIPLSPRDEIIIPYTRWKFSGPTGFYDLGEVAVYVPNLQTSGAFAKFFRRDVVLHHFHGSLYRDITGLYLYGHYRLSRDIACIYLAGINFFLLYGVIVLIVAIAAFGIWTLTGAVTAHLIFVTLVSQLPFFTAIFALPGLVSCLQSRYFEYRDQLARMNTHRLLLDVCGSPPPRKTTE